MTNINTDIALKKRKEREERERGEQQKIERVIKGATKGKKKDWTRKSVAIDDEIIEAMDSVCKKERKLFSQLAREFFLEGLTNRGINLE